MNIKKTHTTEILIAVIIILFFVTLHQIGATEKTAIKRESLIKEMISDTRKNQRLFRNEFVELYFEIHANKELEKFNKESKEVKACRVLIQNEGLL